MSPRPRPIEERFWSKVDRTGDCWLWTAARAGDYGCFFKEGRHHPAHRIAYEISIGPIPAGLVIDHLCRTPLCVNPAHLEAVPQRINVQRGLIYALGAARTHCKRGHLRSAHTYINSKGFPACRPCARAADARYRARRRLAKTAVA